ncbi:adenylate kinase-domain-containing protein [Paraphysoderma sedebokerense]|nr:adenylate kinase-domain-containing protein [Paraphysoderma sedebokerense]
MGAPGSGKGTLSQRISSEFNIMTLSSGDLLREHIRRGTDIGKSVKKQMEKGGLVSDDVIIGMILQEVEIAREKQQSVLLDGFPRTISQAQTLTNYLSSTSPLSLVLNLDVPVSVILSRILDRWVHPGSGRVYNTKYSPPKVEGIDDITGEKLVRRSDDTEETIRTRLQQYQTSISPLLEYYQNQGIVHTFQGETSDQIYPQIQKVLINRPIRKLTNIGLVDA